MESRIAISEADRRAAALMAKTPGLGASVALTLVLQADQRLYRQFCREMKEIGSILDGKAALLELVSEEP